MAVSARSPPKADSTKALRRRYRTYNEARKALDRNRKRLLSLYRKAASRGERLRVVRRAGAILFVHASYGTPPVVVKEDALLSPILTQSRYRIVGRISADPRLVIKWFYRSRFVTKRFKRRRR